MEQRVIQTKNVEEFDNSINIKESDQFTKEEINELIQKSTELMKDFKVYIALLASDSKKQFARIGKTEYDKLQKQRFVGTEREKKFFENLPYRDIIVDSKTFVLTKDNLGLAFYPPIWKTLSLEHKIALCRLARLKYSQKDFTDFVQYDIAAIVMGEKGALNLCSFFSNEFIGSSFLFCVLNAENVMKELYYITKESNNKEYYQKLLNFKSLEELRYICPFSPADWDNTTPKNKALYYDNIKVRKARIAEQKTIDIIKNDAAEMEGLVPLFDEYIEKKQKQILEENMLIIQELGISRVKRDEEFLKMKVDYFNNLDAKEYNKKVRAFNEKVHEMQQTEDMIERYILNEQLKKISKKIDRQKPKEITYEKARKHFAHDLKEKPNKFKHSKNIQKNRKKHIEGYEKMN